MVVKMIQNLGDKMEAGTDKQNGDKDGEDTRNNLQGPRGTKE